MTPSEPSLIERIAHLTDLQAVRSVEYVAARLAPAVPTEDRLAANTDGLDLIAVFRCAAAQDGSRPVAESESGALARELLEAFASDRDFAPLVAHALGIPADEHLLVKAILAMGVAATLIIVATTTEISIDAGPVRIRKHAASPELVHRVAEVLQPYKPSSENAHEQRAADPK